MFGRVQGGRNATGKVCDFFLQGRCKFGDNCKNEHPVSQNNSNNRFAALSGGQRPPTARSTAAGKDMPYGLSKDNIVADVKDERPVWPFSAYGPGRDAPRQLFGGAPLEQSPEEMRVMYYMAQAAGNPQPAIQAEQQLFQQMNEQIQKVISDPQSALQYVLDGDNEHPNRRDMTVIPGQNNVPAGSGFGKPSMSSPFGGSASAPTALANTSSEFGQPSQFGKSAFGQPSQPSGFGQPSAMGGRTAFGQPSQAGTGSAFGQPSQPGSTSAFGQPTQPGATSAFGQPSQAGATSAFGQPSQPGTTSAFGQPSQPGATSAFGQPSQPGATSAFGQPSQPGTTSAFGQPSQPGTGSAFGAPSALGGSGAFGQPSTLGQSTSGFGQPSQPSNPFSNQQSPSPFAQGNQGAQSSPFGAAQGQSSAGAFGQASQPTQSPFGNAAQSNPTPFGGAQQNTSSPFGQNAQASSSPFGQNTGQSQNQANTSAVKSPFTTSHAHPASPAGPSSNAANDTATPPTSSYAQHTNGQLRSWRGNAVKYVDGAPYFSRSGNLNDAKSLEKIWFPDGPPGNNPYMSEAEEMYSKYGSSIEGAYKSCAEQGWFEGSVPLLAPTRAWTRFDI